MRVLILVGSLGVLGLANLGCESILGINDHKLASQGDSGSDAASVTGDSSAIADGSPDSGLKADGALGDGSTDSGDGGSPGGAVPSLLCGGDSGACVSGGIFSVGRVPDDAGVGSLPNGGVATVTDDGFEFGETVCDPTGMKCVTGGLTP